MIRKMNTNDKLAICRKNREIAADTLYQTLKQLLAADEQISETSFANFWLAHLRKNNTIFPNGWYDPPPNGIEMLFASENDSTRINAKNVRPRQFWPQANIFLSRENGLVSLFASPVNRQTGIIGDFGLTLYFGKNPDILKHLKLVYKITAEISDYAQVTMQLCEVAEYADRLMSKEGVYSNLVSKTDPAGTDIGHTIPFSYEEMTKDELSLLHLANKHWKEFKDMINRKRRFVSRKEKLKIMPGMAITIEPRPQMLTREDMPMVWFHRIILFKENGEKELLTNFDKIFKLVGMDYMIN